MFVPSLWCELTSAMPWLTKSQVETGKGYETAIAEIAGWENVRVGRRDTGAG